MLSVKTGNYCWVTSRLISRKRGSHILKQPGRLLLLIFLALPIGLCASLLFSSEAARETVFPSAHISTSESLRTTRNPVSPAPLMIPFIMAEISSRLTMPLTIRKESSLLLLSGAGLLWLVRKLCAKGTGRFEVRTPAESRNLLSEQHANISTAHNR